MVLVAFILSLIISRSFPFAFAALQNITIDDTYGDPVTGAQFSYSPANQWSAQPGCSDCEAQPNANDAYNHTWHDTSFLPTESPAPLNASITFTGSAVYVYCIVSHSSANPDGYTDLRFMIDGEIDGPFIMSPNGMDTYTYNYAVYTNDQLSMAEHTLTIINGNMSGSKSLILLDYVVYTAGTEDQPPVAITSAMITTAPTVSIDLVTLVSTATQTVPGNIGAPLTETVSYTTVIQRSTTVQIPPKTLNGTHVSGSSSTILGTAPSTVLHSSFERSLVPPTTGTLVSPAAYVTPARRVAGGLNTATRTIVIVVSICGGILLSAIATAVILLKRRRHANSRSRERWDFNELPSPPGRRTNESDDYQEARLTTERPITFHDCGSDDDPSWVLDEPSSRGRTPRCLPNEPTAELPPRDTDSHTLNDSVIDISAGVLYAQPTLRLQSIITSSIPNFETPAQDGRQDVMSAFPPSRRTTRTTVATYGGTRTPTSVNDYVIRGPTAPHSPDDSDVAGPFSDHSRVNAYDPMASSAVPTGDPSPRTTELMTQQSNFKSIGRGTPPPSYSCSGAGDVP